MDGFPEMGRDASRDRLVHNAYRVEFDGQSMRKTKLKTGDESVQK